MIRSPKKTANVCHSWQGQDSNYTARHHSDSLHSSTPVSVPLVCVCVRVSVCIGQCTCHKRSLPHHSQFSRLGIQVSLTFVVWAMVERVTFTLLCFLKLVCYAHVCPRTSHTPQALAMPPLTKTIRAIPNIQATSIHTLYITIHTILLQYYFEHSLQACLSCSHIGAVEHVARVS